MIPQVRQFAWPFSLPLDESSRCEVRTSMAPTHSKSRRQAEIAFGEARSQLLARRRAVEERDSIVLARAEKTLRLREARLAKELQDCVTATTAPISKRVR
jgi:hypothetical protein